MTPVQLTVAIFAIMVVLMALRTPIAVAMFVAGAVGYVAQAGWLPLASFLNTQAFARFASYDLSVIPLFILMGNFATQGGISKALFEVAAAAMSRFKGGLAMGAVIACAAFGAICGSSVATGTLAAGGTLGILIPPSVPLVIYAILTEQNIAKLFAAAMIPGAIAMLGYVAAIAIYVRLVPGQAPEHDDDAPGLSVRAVWGVLPILVGGIYGGLFTPTEGAAVGSAATFLAALAKREMTWKKFGDCFYATAEASAMIFMIFLGADLMNSALTLTQVPNQLANLVQGWGLSPFMVVAAIVALYIALGCLMDELSVLLLTIPIFFPVVIGLDFGMPQESVALWFGIVVLMTVSFGLLSPPVGLNVYVVNGMARDVPIAESYRGVLPFLASDLVRLLLLMFFPVLSLWLVQFVG